MNTDKVLALAEEAGFHEEGGHIIAGYNRVVITGRLNEFAALIQREMEAENSELREKLKYYESITTGAEHRAIDRARSAK